MKRTIKLAVAAAVALTSTAAFATNGDNLIGTGAKSRAMGGTGIAHFNGAESATSNPALIAKSKGTAFTFGGTYFSPDVKIKTTDTLAGSGLDGANDLTAESDAKHNIIPYVALTENLGNGFSVGASMFGSAGMGTDWRSSAPLGSADFTAGSSSTGNFGLYSMRSNLLLLKFSVPVAYGQDNWSVGVAPVIMYGALDMAFQTPNYAEQNFGGGNYGMIPTGGSNDVGRGSSNDFGLGYEVGAAYTIPEVGVTVAAKYQSAIMMEYKNQISVAGTAFGYGTQGANFGAFSDKLEQPSEAGLGLDWSQGDVSFTADYKRINWGSAAGYKDFGWENQNVYALGAEYRMDKLALRAGFNYAKNPINNNTDSTAVNPYTTGGNMSINPNTNGDTMNAFNHVMFPAVTERHYTVGAGYQFTKNVGADLALTYATSPDVTVNAASVGLGTLTVSNDQKAASFNLNYTF